MNDLKSEVRQSGALSSHSSTEEGNHFSTYDDFFLFYLRAHSHPANRILHLCGSVLGIAVLIAAFAFGHPWYALLWPVIGYGFAWFGHFVIEGNRPATFGHPWWSFLSDYRMVWLMLTGQLAQWLARAESGSSPRL